MDNKRIICLCTTFFQLLTAIQMRRTLFSEDRFTVVITDGSNGSEKICEKLKEMQIFDDVLYAKGTRENAAGFGSYKNKISRYIQYFRKGPLTSYLKGRYDLFLAFNINWYSFILFNALQIDNHDIQAAKYEEGLVSYYADEHRSDFAFFQKIWKVKKVLRQPTIFQRLKSFYCFYPDFYEGKLLPVQIPSISSDDKWFRETLCSLFDIEADKLSYDKKFIYFASMLDSELLKGKSGEFDIVKDIVDVVGKDNFMVKLHPREDNPQRYYDLGVAIDTNSNVPFEIIQLVRDFSDKIFITCLSGSVINFASIVPERTKTYFTYGMLPEKVEKIQASCAMYDKTIAKMTEVTGTEDFIVLESREQMEEELESIEC